MLCIHTLRVHSRSSLVKAKQHVVTRREQVLTIASYLCPVHLVTAFWLIVKRTCEKLIVIKRMFKKPGLKEPAELNVELDKDHLK